MGLNKLGMKNFVEFLEKDTDRYVEVQHTLEIINHREADAEERVLKFLSPIASKSKREYIN